MLNKTDKIYVAGHGGMVGSAIVRRLKSEGYANIITRLHSELDLTRQDAVEGFFNSEKIDYVVLAAAKVGGIYANNTYPAEFIYQNLAIETHVIHAAYSNGVKRLLFLGSSCVYPKQCQQPMKEEYLLSGPLEPTNEPYAIAKIAGIKLCESYNRQFGTQYRTVMPTNLYGLNDNYDLENSHVLAALIRKFNLAKFAFEKNWDAIRKDEKVYGKIPDDISIALGIPSANGDSFTESIASPTPRVILWGTGGIYREFLHVDDLAQACLLVMNLTGASDRWTMMNVGTGDEIEIGQLAELVSAIVGYEGDIGWDATKPDGMKKKLLDVSRMKELGWAAGISLQKVIALTQKCYLERLNL